MIAADSSVLIAWFKGEAAQPQPIAVLMNALRTRQLALPPVVVTELFAAPTLPPEHAEMVRNLQTLPLVHGYWERAGQLRSKVSGAGFKARLGDVLVAQACIDSDVPLIVSDRDFRHFTQHGLQLAT